MFHDVMVWTKLSMARVVLASVIKKKKKKKRPNSFPILFLVCFPEFWFLS